jgi:hypothetical protein
MGRFRFVALVALTLALLPGLANAQAVIKVSDTVNFRLGIVLQAWFDEQQLSNTTGGTAGWQQNIFLRRARFIVGGQLAKDVTFFFMTDNPNLGKAVGATAKAPGTGFIIQDAFLEWKPANEFILDAGLILIPLCRNCLQSAAALLSLDYGTWSFQNSAATQSSVGRDTGLQSKGYLAGDHFEYRLGIFQGFRQAGSRNAFRAAGRVQYNVFDVEKGPFYIGTYLGKKKILAIGGGFDSQSDYMAYAGDVFFDWPVGKGDGVTIQADYIHYDGGKTFTTPATATSFGAATNALLKQNDFFAEAGYYCSKLKLMPFGRYESQNYDNAANKVLNKTFYQFGLTWYPYGHNFNIKGAFTRKDFPNDPKTFTTNEFTVQLQAFYY